MALARALRIKAMAVIDVKDIISEGGVEQALEKKRAEALSHKNDTGSYPEWWEEHITVGKTRGAPRKFSCPDEYFSKGYEYFERCAERHVYPTISGLVIHMGFTNRSTMYGHVRRNPEFRDAHATLMTMLQSPLERSLHEPGGQQGKIFLLKNIPEGMAVDDPVDKPMHFPWQDKRQTELTGADGTPIEVSRKMSPEEGYFAMLNGGRLAPKEDESLDDAETIIEGEAVNEGSTDG